MTSVIEVLIPQENVNDDFVLILAWLVSDGDAVRPGQPLVEVETSKSTFEVVSPAAGVIKILTPQARELPVGEVMALIGENHSVISDHFVKSTKASSAISDPTPSPQSHDAAVLVTEPRILPPSIGTRFSRDALELIRQRGLNESDFMGNGLIRKADVLAKLGSPIAPLAEPKKAESVVAPRGATGVAFKTESLPRAKRVEAKLLSWSHRNALQSSVTTAVPIKPAAKNSQKHAEDNELRSAAIIYECGRLLLKYPFLNAFCTDSDVHFYQQINIGYALDAGNGLRTPVLRNAEKLSLPQIVERRRQFLVDYLDGDLAPESLAGGTFTVTDLSGAGVHSFHPLIVESQAAILGIGCEVASSSTSGGSYNLILAFDHRLAEGRMASNFIKELKERMLGYEENLIASKSEPKTELCCSRCFSVISDIKTMKGYLVQVADGANDQTRWICTTCLMGW